MIMMMITMMLMIVIMITIKINSRLYTIDSNPHYLEPCFNSNQNRVPLVFRHTFTVILPSVTRTLEDSNLPLITRTSFSFPSDHFYRIHGSAVGKWNKIFIRFFRSTKDTRGMDPHGWLWAVQV